VVLENVQKRNKYFSECGAPMWQPRSAVRYERSEVGLCRVLQTTNSKCATDQNALSAALTSIGHLASSGLHLSNFNSRDRVNVDWTQIPRAMTVGIGNCSQGALNNRLLYRRPIFRFHVVVSRLWKTVQPTLPPGNTSYSWCQNGTAS